MGAHQVTITDTAFGSFEPATPSSAGSSAFIHRPQRVIRVRVASEALTPSWLSYVLRRLNQLSDQPGPSDETDAPRPDPAALTRALPVLLSVLGPMGVDAPAPSVVPTAEFGVQFVWHRAGWDVEVEVGPAQTLVWAQNRSVGTMWEGNLDERRSELGDVLRAMMGAA